MHRFTHLIAVLVMLGLGTGLSQALHHLVAHGETGRGATTCSTGCDAGHAFETHHDEQPAGPTHHHEDDCPVCATIAATKLLAPAPIACLGVMQPSFEVAPLERLITPPPTTLRVQRSRAPPTT